MALQINKAFEREQIKDILEMKTVPKAVDERLEKLYAELPGTLPAAPRSARAAERSGYKGLRIAAASAAAAVVLSFGTLCAFPAFASTLPVIGGIFRAFNNYQEGENVNESREHIQTNSARIDSAPVAVPTADGGEMTAALSEAYYDGRYVFIGIEAKAAPGLDQETLYTDCADIYINGECQTTPDGMRIRNDGGYVSLTPNDYQWQRTEDGRYINERSFRVPDRFRDLDSLDIKIAIDGIYYIEEVEGDPGKTVTVIEQVENEDGTITENVFEAPAGYYDDDGNFVAEKDYVNVPVTAAPAEFSLTVTKTADADVRVIEGNGLEMGGVKLESVTLSPAAAEFMLEYPDAYNDPATGAYYRNGGALGCLEETEPVRTENGKRYARIFSGVSAGETREIIYAVYDKNDTNEFVAVFIVDPANGTVRTGTAADVPDSFFG